MYIERGIDWYMYEMIIPINNICHVLWKSEFSLFVFSCKSANMFNLLILIIY